MDILVICVAMVVFVPSRLNSQILFYDLKTKVIIMFKVIFMFKFFLIASPKAYSTSMIYSYCTFTPEYAYFEPIHGFGIVMLLRKLP
jgi:hypothetical protein